MISFKTYLTEVKKKEILAGLDLIRTMNADYFKPAIMFQLEVDRDFLNEIDGDEIGYDQVDALLGKFVPKMPLESTPLKTPHFYLGPERAPHGDAVWIYSTHPTVLKAYKDMEQEIDLDDEIIDELHNLIYGAYREAVGK